MDKERLLQERESILEHVRKDADRFRKMVRLIQDVVIPSVRRNDGRVLNRNLCSYIKSQANNPNIEVNLLEKPNENGNRELVVTIPPFSYYSNGFILEVITRPSGERNTPRIDANATLDMKLIIPQIDAFWREIREKEKVENNIDEYMEIAAHFQSEIERWYNLPYSFTSECSLSKLLL